MTTKLPISAFAAWLSNGERGQSSEAIVEHFTGEPVGGRAHRPSFGRGDHPYDMGDFRRCELLLRRVDVARLVFPEMVNVSPQWARLVEAWDDIVATAEEEAPGIFTTECTQARTPRAYDLIRKAIQ